MLFAQLLFWTPTDQAEATDVPLAEPLLGSDQPGFLVLEGTGLWRSFGEMRGPPPPDSGAIQSQSSSEAKEWGGWALNRLPRERPQARQNNWYNNAGTGFPQRPEPPDGAGWARRSPLPQPRRAPGPRPPRRPLSPGPPPPAPRWAGPLLRGARGAGTERRPGGVMAALCEVRGGRAGPEQPLWGRCGGAGASRRAGGTAAGRGWWRWQPLGRCVRAGRVVAVQGRVKGEGGPGKSGVVGDSEAGVAVGGSAGLRGRSVLLWGGIVGVGLGQRGSRSVVLLVVLGVGCCFSWGWSVFVESGISRLLEGFWRAGAGCWGGRAALFWGWLVVWAGGSGQVLRGKRLWWGFPAKQGQCLWEQGLKAYQPVLNSAQFSSVKSLGFCLTSGFFWPLQQGAVERVVCQSVLLQFSFLLFQ